ncbi:fumarylacetoacetate hydrolase family protein [Haematospirillum sp. H1815]|nr:fumarylacetoacetate hydrolase family protein [Haematospirillum sp. H1815]
MRHRCWCCCGLCHRSCRHGQGATCARPSPRKVASPAPSELLYRSRAPGSPLTGRSPLSAKQILLSPASYGFNVLAYGASWRPASDKESVVGFVIPECPPSSVAVHGTSDRFPVRRIFCVGSNYAAHAREMGRDPAAEAPFFFSKPADAVCENGSSIPFPSVTSNLHHEVELVLALKAGGEDLDEQAAGACLFGCAVGIDLTRRDLQAEAKSMGRPWDMAKGFDLSAPVGTIMPMEAAPLRGAIQLAVNGRVRQDGKLEDMILGPVGILVHLSRLVRLSPGDLIFTGTPEGVAALQPGDKVHASIEGIPALEIMLASR